MFGIRHMRYHISFRKIVDLALKKDYTVRAITRTGVVNGDLIGPKLEDVRVDIRNSEELTQALKGLLI
jgi:uncharacterized protein YbjT (DUF2867 family)